MERPHEYIFVDEAGFNLMKRRRRGRNIISQQAIIKDNGQRGGNITHCAVIHNCGVLHRHTTLGPCNAQHLLIFLGGLWDVLFVHEQQTEHLVYVIIWSNVSFLHSVLIREWFNINQRFIKPYSSFLNPIDEFFSALQWKVYDQKPYAMENLLLAMNLACGNIGMESYQGWIWHTRGFFPVAWLERTLPVM